MAGFFQRLKEGLTKSRQQISQKVDQLAENTAVVDDEFFEELTDILVMADSGVSTAEYLVDRVKEKVRENKIKSGVEAKEVFKTILVEHMNIPRPVLKWPMVMLVVGVNGVGKTTTVGKLAMRFKEVGRSVVLAAADTFRAAADEQLSVWADRANVQIVKHKEGGDPTAVVYDAIQSAKAKKTDLLIVDTAGRLHNKKKSDGRT